MKEKEEYRQREKDTNRRLGEDRKKYDIKRRKEKLRRKKKERERNWGKDKESE